MPNPCTSDLPTIDDYVDSSDSEFGCAKAGWSTGDEGGGDQSPSPSEGARANILKAPRTNARKRRASSQSGDAR